MINYFGCQKRDSAVSYCYFFGAYCALYGIKDGAAILHTPSGCQRRILYLWSMHDNSSNFKLTLSTNIIDKDVIFGTEKKLKKMIEDTIARYNDKVIFIITSCVPEIVGINYDLVLQELHNEKGTKIIPLNTPGFRGDFYEGYSDTLQEIIMHLPKDKKKSPRKINIVGYMFTRYEDDEKSNINELKNLLDKLGLEINAVFFGGSSYEELKNFSQAEYNIIFPYGADCEKYLQDEVHQKNIICDLPIGLEKTIEFIEKVAKMTKTENKAKTLIKNQLRKIVPKLQNTVYRMTGKKLAIVTDEQSVFGILNMILEFGMEPVVIGIYNSKSSNIKKQIEKIISKSSTINYKPLIIEGCSRKQIKDAIKNHYVDLCIGSSIEARDLEELGVSVLEYSFPLFEKHYNFPSPILGFSGLENLNTRIFNILNRKALRRESVAKKLESIKNETLY